MENKLNIAIQNMGIYELRNYAREVGVASPTTLKRQELINAIMNIQNGELKPVKGLKRGRKPKNKESVDLNKFIPEQSNYQFDDFNRTLKLNSPTINYGYSDSGYGKLVNGVIKLNSDGTGDFSYEDNVVKIPASKLNNLQIEDGEQIQVNFIKDESEKYIVHNVMKLVSEYSFCNLESVNKHYNLKMKSDNVLLKKFFDTYQLKAGQCVLVSYEKTIDSQFVILNMARSMQQINLEKIAVLSNGIQNSEVSSNFNIVKQITVTDSALKRAQNIENMLEYSQFKAETGSDCVMFIGNLSAVYNTYYQIAIQKTENKEIAKDYALQKISNILALAKQTKHGSLTIFAFAISGNEYIDYCEDLINAEINIIEKNGEYKLKDSFSIYKKEI